MSTNPIAESKTVKEMTNLERRRLGQETMREVMGTEPPAVPLTPYRQASVDSLFAEVWSRPDLTRKERRWITISCVSAVGQAAPIRNHVRAALASGDVTFEEMKEFVLQFAMYCGFAAAGNVEQILLELMQEEGLELPRNH